LKLSQYAFSIGLPGRMKCSATPRECAQASSALLVNSGPLSQTIAFGAPRTAMISLRTRATRKPEIDVSTSIARHSRVGFARERERFSCDGRDALARATPHDQAFGAIDSIHAFVIHLVTVATKQHMKSSITEARSLGGVLPKRDDELRRIDFARAISVARSRQPEAVACTTLTDVESLLRVAHGGAASRRLHHFFRITALVI
jgi:hypothetical protein